MARCQHCKKLTHSEHVDIYFDLKDFEKIQELDCLKDWAPVYLYSNGEMNPSEIGKLKCGDIVLHFIAVKEKEEG